MAKKAQFHPEQEDKEHYNGLDNRLDAMSSGHSRRDNFATLMEIMAIGFANQVRTKEWQEREERYKRLISQVDKRAAVEASSFIMRWFMRQERPKDLLGPYHSYVGMDNAGSGQFFTPSHVAEFMGMVTLGSKEDIEKIIADKGYVGIQDPTAGAGGLLVNAAKVLHQYDIDYRKYALFNGMELMPTTAHACFVQCALYGMPAIISHGNAFTMEEFDTYITLPGWRLMARCTPGDDIKEAAV